MIKLTLGNLIILLLFIGTASIALSATARPLSFKVNRRSINFGTCVFGSVTLKYIEVGDKDSKYCNNFKD